MKLQKLFLTSALILSFGISGFGYAQDKIVIKAAHTTSEDYPYQIGFLAMAKALNEKTNGKVDMQIFPNGSLGGDERKCLNQFSSKRLE